MLTWYIYVSEWLEFGLMGREMNLTNEQRLDGLYSDAKIPSYLTLAPELNGADFVKTLRMDSLCTYQTDSPFKTKPKLGIKFSVA